MGIKVVPYQEELIPAVKDFNGRLSRGGVAFRFPESPVPGCLPKVDGRETYQEYFVALESGFVDCLAAREDAETVMQAATRHLERAGIDLIVSNQAALGWREALRRAGYLTGPSNFVFAASRELDPAFPMPD